MGWSTSRVVIVTVVLASLGLGLGIIIGHFGITTDSSGSSSSPLEDETISKKLMETISAENIRQNLREITLKPHIAGRPQDEEVLVNMIKERWEKSGFDSVRVYSYDVLLSYPEQGNSNYIAVVNGEREESDISQRKEAIIDPEQNDANVVDPFNAYSRAGVLEGELVFVNYGRIEDFIELNRTLMIDTRGKICISKYGKIFRGDKVRHAEEYGCIGLILYSDPVDYTVPWGDVYNKDWFLPSTGVQRGTLWVDDGDPRTPDYPSIPTAWHVPEKDWILPKIVVTPIGYIDAVKYLEKMAGPVVNETWKGGLNITYRYGPGFRDQFATSKIKMSVRTKDEVAITRNVIGYIKGAVEPDRYVILGNHRDAWVFGALDPSSGTALQLELARAFGEMLKQGWRPRRTIMFCSWGAEEYGLIGSTEWVEELQKELQFRAISYLNLDTAVNGNYTFRGRGVHSLRNVVFDATDLVPNPDQSEVEAGRNTVYKTWLERSGNGNSPSFGALGSGSDYTAFLQLIGVSSIDMQYSYDSSIGLASYPVYHSVYETFEYVETFIDPEFKVHRAVGQVWGEITRKLSDSVLLTIDCRLYGEFLDEKRIALVDGYGVAMEGQGIDLSQLQQAIVNFSTSAEDFHKRLDAVDLNNALEVRSVNDQMMQLERSFIGQNPLLGRTAYRHIINAPSQHNTYGDSAFPGITDALFDIDADPDQEGRWNEVKRQYSIVIFHILSAAASLEPVVPGL